MDRRRLLRLWFRYSRYFIIALVAGAIGFFFVFGAGYILRGYFTKSIAGENSIVGSDEIITEGPLREGGQKFDFYIGRKFRPDTAKKAMTVPYLALIPERQDQQVPAIASGRVILESEGIDTLVGDFIVQWDTFDPNTETQLEYGQRLAKFIMPDKYEKIYDRVENHQNRAVGFCADCSGSVVRRDALDPKYTVRLRARADNQMYVTAQSIVAYTGRSENLNAATYRRSYGIVVQRYNNEWRIARIAADALAREYGY